MEDKKFIALKPFNNKIYYKNAIFSDNPAKGSPYIRAARKLLQENGFEMNTIDLLSEKETYKEVYIEAPYPWQIGLWIRIVKNRKKNILFIGEPPLINPFSFFKICLIFFSKIYTWNDNLLDNKKYFKYVLPRIFKKITLKRMPFEQKKLLILMNSNLGPFLPFQLLTKSSKELYSERIKAIDFFNKFYPADFSLYGRGWNKPQKFSLKQRLFGYKKYKTYKGEFPQKDKYKILSLYKFCLCFENSATIGYISEKIFDCFKGKTVPIYLGAPNISDHINPKCFIDYRKFKSFNELVHFLQRMNEKTYNGYLNEIEKLLSSKVIKNKWSVDTFAKTFLKAVLK